MLYADRWIKYWLLPMFSNGFFILEEKSRDPNLQFIHFKNANKKFVIEFTRTEASFEMRIFSSLIGVHERRLFCGWKLKMNRIFWIFEYGFFANFICSLSTKMTTLKAK